MAGEGSDPTNDLHGRESLTPVFDNLNAYEVTMHFNGQSTVWRARCGDAFLSQDALAGDAEVGEHVGGESVLRDEESEQGVGRR